MALEDYRRCYALAGLGKPHNFKGKLRKIRIVSNNLGYGPCPEPDEEIEQRLTITSAGKVWLSRYCYGDFNGDQKLLNKTTFSISEDAAAVIMSAMTEYFSIDYDISFATDVGSWDLELTNEDGKIFRMTGSLFKDLIVPGGGLSDIIREKT